MGPGRKSNSQGSKLSLLTSLFLPATVDTVFTATIHGTVVSVYEVGCLFGALFAFYFGEAFGRRRMVYRASFPSLFLPPLIVPVHFSHLDGRLTYLIALVLLFSSVGSFVMCFGCVPFLRNFASESRVLSDSSLPFLSFRTIIQVTAYGTHKGFLQFLIGRVITVRPGSSSRSSNQLELICVASRPVFLPFLRSGTR